MSPSALPSLPEADGDAVPDGLPPAPDGAGAPADVARAGADGVAPASSRGAAPYGVASGELAPLPLPLIESLVLGPVIGVARRWLSGIDDVDLGEAADILPDRIWRSLSP